MTVTHRPTTRPGKVTLAGVGVVWPGQDSLASPHSPVDSIVDKKIFGDQITNIIQFLFQQPPWVMWGGVVLAAIIAFFLLRFLWPRRQAIITWFRTRSRAVTFAMIAGVAVVIGVAGIGGYKANHFVETDKRFCTGCHIFVPSGQVLPEAPDSGSYTVVPLLEGKHDTLSCHACHPLKPVKEAVKLVFWMSGVRDKEIPEHAKVPRQICEQCHVQGAAKKTWQAIAATAGHRVHLESDSSAMKDKKECLTCHARTAHRFVPVNQTCGQSGCHEEKDTKIVLGKMATQGDFHCAACHVFTATVPLLATRDSAAGTLRPALQQCFKCHEMKQRLPDFDAAKDPHNGTCGMCHNPHTQKAPSEARQTCTTANCHADWRKELFHVGAQHKKVGEKCLTCHQPHQARVDASDCQGCHERAKVSENGKPFKPPLPFDTTKALRQSLLTPPATAPAAPEPLERPSKVKGDAPPLEDTPAVAHPPPREVRTVPAQPADSFEHARHKKLACLTCHNPAGPKDKITFTAPRGCQICHHQKPTTSDCATCHTREELIPGRHVTISVAAAGKPARQRPVDFAHEKHHDVECLKCHTAPVYLTAADSVKSCNACHADHHEAGRDCATCHRTTAITEPHALPVMAHVKCDACHTTAKVATLEPKRTFCLTCHAPEQDHYPPAECTSCHFLTSPAGYQPRLIKSESAR
jgi:hypothetical protein